jgi:monovalent cation:proton antiporter-2 (CPA2) family protein
MHDLLIYLLCMVIVIPLSKRFGLGAVIGYLIVGAMVGHNGFNLLQSSQEATFQIAEFGVIMMLLVIGLELNPSLLWKMRGPIFGLGALQVLGSITLFFGACFLLGFAWPTALAIGMILSVSSTAIVLQTLQEQGYAKSAGGERAFAVLLFQDMAVIPFLALFPILGAGFSAPHTESPGIRALLVLGAVAAVVLSGRFLVRPLFKAISRLKLRETFTALALLIVVASATLMHFVGMSPALGAFLAGVVLADSEFKHQIEADIEPFKGLLLGLFFITVGSTIQFGLLTSQPVTIGLWVLGLILGKCALIYAIGRICKLRPPESLLFAVSLAQGGEFAFVMIAQAGDLLKPEVAQILTASVALSMAIAPLLIKLTIQRWMSKLDCAVVPEDRPPDVVDESERDNPVLVIGAGRFGQTLLRFLRANGYASTVLDIDSEQIESIARFGIKSYFGDGANPELLRAAGLDRAKALVIAIDEPETTTKIVETIRPQYPHLPIFCRAYDRIHAYKLLHLGVQEIAIETSGSAVTLGTDILQILGMTSEQADAKGQLFGVNNRRSIRDLAKRFHEDDLETFIQASKRASDQLEAMFKSDPEELLVGASSDWISPAERELDDQSQ